MIVKKLNIFLLLFLVKNVYGGKPMNQSQIATLGGGCFWCVEAVFQRVKGVLDVKPGYAGGHTKNPTYKEICTGLTGHAEVVQIKYDSSKTSYEKLLDALFRMHDPTQLNRQGNDIGPQYRSCIFTTEETDKDIVARCMVDAESLWGEPLTTTVEPLQKFWPAESEHDNYFALHSQQPYCAAVVSPKVAKVRAAFSEIYETE